jgi:signal transduction histidine kinase
LDTPLGALLVSARAANQPLSASDVALLRDVAQQVGIALHVVHLTADLQAARERLVIAREEERRRIRNDLHDGLAPTLASLQLQLAALGKLIRQKPDQAEAIANDLREDLVHATAEIRQLVYALRPPMLDELGVVEAIKHFRLPGSVMSFEVTAPEPMPPLPAAVEVAVYRIASEAINNVVKHAEAQTCKVRIEVCQGQLTLTVTDNGTSMPERYQIGVGFHSMQERAAELGGVLSIQLGDQGGTQVVARLPIAS